MQLIPWLDGIRELSEAVITHNSQEMKISCLESLVVPQSSAYINAVDMSAVEWPAKRIR